MRVAVVGIGGTGSAAARHLAQAGHEVVGYEQFRPGHDRGSSHGESRIIRYTYPDALYTAMMADAYPLWRALEEQAQEELLVQNGGLYFGRHDDPNVIATERALAGAGLPYERLAPEAAQERFPAFRFGADEIALYQDAGGLLRATRCVLANARLAQSSGATLHEETAVSGIVPRGDTVLVRTQGGDEAEYDRVIVTAGAWMGQLFAELRLPLRVTRQQVTYLRIARHAELFAPDRLPVWIDATDLYYGFPCDGHVPGVKFASHVQGSSVDPDQVERTVDADYIQQAAEYAAQRMPDLAAEVTYAQVCLYTNTPNEDFILDHLPDNSNIWLVSGCSGHGFKFTVLLGKIVADLATGGSYARDLSRFRLANFRAA
jgi:sarcosine oxidase